ncbi:hypothetical protein F4778DRAFT_801419, partial [Xylariomycetidae sp. FL2044]
MSVTYSFASPGDLTLLVRERDTSIEGADGHHPIIQESTFRVLGSKIREFTDILERKDLRKEGGVIVIDHEMVAAVKLWMEAIHNDVPDDNYHLEIRDVWAAIHFGQKYLKARKQGAELGTLATQSVPVKDMSKLREWFENWCENHQLIENASWPPENWEHLKYCGQKDIEKLEKARLDKLLGLIAPAYWFESRLLFLNISKEITYSAMRYLKNVRPVTFNDQLLLGLPRRVLDQMQSARANLHTSLQRGIGSCPEVPAACESCKKVITFSYYKSLSETGKKEAGKKEAGNTETGNWPLRYKNNRFKGLHNLLDGLGSFEFEPVRISGLENGASEGSENDITPHTEGLSLSSSGETAGESRYTSGMCSNCESSGVTSRARERTERGVHGAVSAILHGGLIRERKRDAFDGLCLGCFQKFKFGDPDSDYWKHAKNRRWDTGCGVYHGQPSWYFSFFGRREEMDTFLAEYGSKSVENDHDEPRPRTTKSPNTDRGNVDEHAPSKIANREDMTPNLPHSETKDYQHPEKGTRKSALHQEMTNAQWAKA